VSAVISVIMQPFEFNIKFHELIGTKEQNVFHMNTGSGAPKGRSATTILSNIKDCNCLYC